MKLIRKPAKPEYQWPLFLIPTSYKSHLEIWQKYLPKVAFAKLSLN
jgi:hypothetical protein